MANIWRDKGNKCSSEEETRDAQFRYSDALKIHFTYLAFIVTASREKKKAFLTRKFHA